MSQALPTSLDQAVAIRTWHWLCGLLILTVLAYLPGLGGPFMLDDMPNIVIPVGDWLRHETGWQELVFGNGSGMLGRSVSMLSFLVTAWIGGLDPYVFKLGNLTIHLACGLLIYALLARLLVRDPAVAAQSRRFALVVSALWLLHPLQVSTVLYAVQRMAQLSTLFTLLALLVFVHGREQLEYGRERAAAAWLFLLLPLVTVAAVLSKENGALVPLLCGVIELGYFQASAQKPRPRLVHAFFALFLLIPGLVVSAWYALHPERLLQPYLSRTFTLGERLLSEPRALMDYMGTLLLPRGPSMGLYTDDFAVSRGLLDPPSTLFAIIGLLALAAAALLSRKRLPMVFTGIGLFLAAHAMESTVFALELHFEHRNYLPSFGFLLALAGVGAWLGKKALAHAGDALRMAKSFATGTTVLILLLAMATFARAGIWSSFEMLATQGVQQHPQSFRALLDYSVMLHKQGRIDQVQATFDRMAGASNPAAPHVAAIDTLALQCMSRGEADTATLARVASIAGEKLQQYEMLAFDNLTNILASRKCRQLSPQQLAALIVSIVDAAPQPAALMPLWRNRFIAAKLFVQAEQFDKAEEQLRLAWKTGTADPGVGVFLANVEATNHDFGAARGTLAEVRRKLRHWDKRGTTKIAELEQRIDAASPPSPLQPSAVIDPPPQ